VYTGNVFFAGTDANVYITLYGELGQSQEIYLDQQGKNLFEAGE
jgi:hypothetical protein